MGQLLVVVPEDWLEIDWAYTTGNTELTATSLQYFMSSGQSAYVDEILKNAGLIPLNTTLVEAKVLDDAFFMVRLG